MLPLCLIIGVLMSHDTHVDNPNGVGYFGLIGLVVSSCIGSGVLP